MAVESDLVSRIKTRQSEVALALAEGRADTFEKYNRLVGLYQGLGESLQFVEDLMARDDD